VQGKDAARLENGGESRQLLGRDEVEVGVEIADRTVQSVFLR